MRHAKSCSNHIRDSGSGKSGESGKSDPNILLSQSLRDPGLSLLGERTARRYGPILKRRLRVAGFDIDGALICASALRRAQDTARIVFTKDAVVLPHFAENGNIPENTPAGSAYAAPSWTPFLRHLSTLVREGDSIAVVGHGSYLRSLWPLLTGSARAQRLNNLDGILLDVDLTPTGVRVHSFKEIPSNMNATGNDKCMGQGKDLQKLAVLGRGMTRKQRGGNGSTGMPLAYFQDGAQMRGMSGDATGGGLASSSASWVRPPLSQTGGRARRQRTRRRLQHGGFGLRAQRTRHIRLSQRGGFTSSVMGAFAANGARLMPVAAYMGYKMYKNRRTMKKRNKRR